MQTFINPTLRVAAVNFMPFVHTNNNVPVDGVDIRIIQEATKDLFEKLDFKIFPFWGLALKALEEGDQDIAIGGHWQIAVSGTNLSMSIPYGQSCQTLLVPKPVLLPQETYIFQPLHGSLWLYLTVMIFLVSATLTYLNIKFDLEPKSFWDNMLYVFQAGTLSGNSSDLNVPRGISFVRVFWCTNALIMSTAYSAGFTSILASPRYTKPTNTIDDLLEAHLVYAHTKGGEVIQLRRSSDPRIRRFMANIFQVHNFAKRSEVVHLNKYVFSTQLLSKHYITETHLFDEYGKAHLKLLLECLFVSPYVVAFRRKSQLIRIFNKAIQSYIENGFISCWLSKMELLYGGMRMADFFVKDAISEPSPLKMIRIQGIFYVLIIGNLCAFCVFITELSILRNSKKTYKHYYLN